MGSKIGVVYGHGSGTVRRMITPDQDEELDGVNHVGPGEAMLIVNRELVEPRRGDPPDVDRATALVEAFRGRASLSPRCALVSPTGVVIDVLLADPDIDAHPEGRIVRHDKAQIGWRTSNGAIVDPSNVSVAADDTGVSD